jgi:predicted metal-dependent HD superfamily phosphohydrolase
MKLKEATHYIFQRMENELPSNLYYHSVIHVKDVMHSARQLAEMEGINEYEKELLFTAVSFHDCGFIYQTGNHEEKGCEIAQEILPQFDYTNEEIARICGMIMATKIPQTPNNILEEIICDADLDYLGRDDFWAIGDKLFQELTELGIIQNENEWNKLQQRFLSSHTYFTQSAKKLREAQKEAHLEKVIKNTHK